MSVSNDKLTLVIPTHNRHRYLKRSFEYYKDLEAEIFYCDSSIKRYSGIVPSSIKYLHLPESNFFEKIKYVLTTSKTKYIALCADDDFILIESLTYGTSFLQKNNDFKTVLGRNVMFHERFDGDFYVNDFIPLNSEINYNASGNAKLFFKNYQQILWGLYSADVLGKAVNALTKISFSNENFVELFIGAICCYCGGIKILDDIWSVRELSSATHWGDKNEALTYKIYFNKKDNDLYNFITSLDEITHKGFAEIVIKSYLGSPINKKLYYFVKSKIEKFPLAYDFINNLYVNSRDYENSFEKYPKLKSLDSLTVILPNIRTSG